MFDIDVEQLLQGADHDTLIGAVAALGLVLFFTRLMWRRLRRQRGATSGKVGGWSLNRPILWWSQTEALTLGNAFEGIFICGATGSGKTTGSGREIAQGLLRSGAGGIVFTVKPDDPELWIKYARETGRSKDLILFGPDQSYDFVAEESRRCGLDLVEISVDLFSIACEIADRGIVRGGGQEDSAFWTGARNQLLRNSLVALNLAYGRTTVQDLLAFVTSLPQTLQQVKSARWRKSFSYLTFVQAEKNCRPEQEEDLRTSFKYCTRQLPAAGDRTQGNVLLTLTSTIDILARGLANKMLCSKSTITPEMIERGAVVVFSIPIASHGITSRLIQGIVRYCFQRAMLRRDVKKSPRPVFFWADEAQYTANTFDVTFLSTCRSSRIANVYLTQNLSGMYSALGGLQKGKAEADGILANLNLKIMHANGCPLTNDWAARSIGHSKQPKFSVTNSYQPTDVLADVFGFGPAPGMNAGYTEEVLFEVMPAEFTRLRTGGAHHNYLVDAIAFQSGRVFSDTGRTWRNVTFRQKV